MTSMYDNIENSYDLFPKSILSQDILFLSINQYFSFILLSLHLKFMKNQKVLEIKNIKSSPAL